MFQLVDISANQNIFSKQQKVLNQLQGTIKSIKTAGLVQALYKLGGMRPFLIIYANSLEYKPEESANEKLQCQSLFILLSAVRLDLSFSTDFVRLRKLNIFYRQGSQDRKLANGMKDCSFQGPQGSNMKLGFQGLFSYVLGM